jgi:hypothetical protein
MIIFFFFETTYIFERKPKLDCNYPLRSTINYVVFVSIEDHKMASTGAYYSIPPP